jgi:hypothetical protein
VLVLYRIPQHLPAYLRISRAPHAKNSCSICRLNAILLLWPPPLLLLLLLPKLDAAAASYCFSSVSTPATPASSS